MSNQILTKTRSILDRIFVTPIIRLDENFYEDEELLAAGLAAPTPDCLRNQSLPEVALGEFEKQYNWYLS